MRRSLLLLLASPTLAIFFHHEAFEREALLLQAFTEVILVGLDPGPGRRCLGLQRGGNAPLGDGERDANLAEMLRRKAHVRFPGLPAPSD